MFSEKEGGLLDVGKATLMHISAVMAAWRNSELVSLETELSLRSLSMELLRSLLQAVHRLLEAEFMHTVHQRRA